jgi:N-methylhydantoinase B
VLDPIELQVIVGTLRAACEEMGAVLIRSAWSANIKERRDASTALFDAHGEMVMQAEHIPVHLGAMPAAVAAVRALRQRPGVSWILNDPFAGGTHLPDITVVTPVFADSQAADSHAAGSPAAGSPAASSPAASACAASAPAAGSPAASSPAASACAASAPAADSHTLLGFAASRAHHADVGGRVPGSMPADSRLLEEEGIVIAARELNEQAIAEIAQSTRQPRERRADLRAQLAANRVGARRLAELGRRVGVAPLQEAMRAVLDYAERRARACLAALPDGEHYAQDVLEGAPGDLRDLPLRLRAVVRGEHLTLDFSGSAGRHAGNLNCPLAVTRSACYFAVRVLSDPDIPPSAGAYRPIEVLAPEGSLLNAMPDEDGNRPAVAGGNVETSSRVADLVLQAFGRACGQGTMNNLTLGDGQFSFYETLGGGQGACPDADGPSGVHVAMSNTLNTPVEALEREFPLRVKRYEIRRGSGGAGRQRGGEGVVRELEALREMQFSLISERRRHAPPGAAGGQPGAKGRNLLKGAPPNDRELPGKASGTLRAGERLCIETPGGGGYGDA